MPITNEEYIKEKLDAIHQQLIKLNGSVILNQNAIIELEKNDIHLKNKLNFYNWIVPILTTTVGVLMTYLIFNQK